jgi:arginine/lysine/ornithine decarboxylase
VSLTRDLTAYIQKQTARFHMPGHKGRLAPPFDGIAPFDLTELPGTGDLYHETDGAIRRSERKTAALYNAADCFYLTGGATQGVFAMLSAAAKPGDTVYAARNCHRSVTHAMALLDLRPVWFTRPPPQDAALVVYTSPDYYGDIPPRPEVQGVVLCDAAHGAHLPFCTRNYTPPGHLWVTSAHKTLGALGQAAMLLSDGTFDAGLLRGRTAVFGTASPSYLLLASLDAAARNGGGDWARVVDFSKPYIEEGADPAKITVHTQNGTGQAARIEREFGVVCEMADSHRIVFMLSPHNTEEDFSRLKQALSSLAPPCEKGLPRRQEDFPDAVLTLREAFFAPREKVLLQDAEGRIAAEIIALSPPGIPLVNPGERIDKKTLEILSKVWYNDEITVVS